MGHYLNMNTNTKTNPNENYAREVMQLFSIGTDLLNMDGTTLNDVAGPPLPTYDQRSIDKLKLVLTGWKIQNNVPCDPASQQGSTCADYLNPMIFDATKHEPTDKVLFQGSRGQFRSRAMRRAPRSSTPRSTSCSATQHRAVRRARAHPQPRDLEPEPGLRRARGLGLQRRRHGVRGSLWAVVKAILLDPEARTAPADPTTAS